MPNRSLSIEFNDFFRLLIDSNPATKAVFTAQRVKLLPIFFQVWNCFLVDCFYKHHVAHIKYWRGFRLLAVDGSTANLINKEDIINYFGTQDNQYATAPMARIMQVYDVLNDMIIFINIYPIKTSEKKIITNHIHNLFSDCISIFDRGFPSYELMYLMINEEASKHFVIKCKVDFNNDVKQFIRSRKNSKIIELKPTPHAIASLKSKGLIITSKTIIKIRMVKLNISFGVTEILLTNHYDELLYSNEELKCLYALRWGIEASYSTQKNQMQMEQFSEHRIICIQKDFHAGIFESNLQSLINKQCDDYIEKINLKRKHRYKINNDVSCGSLKNKIVKLFFEHNPKELLIKLQLIFSEKFRACKD
jgi:hypothetical protein